MAKKQNDLASSYSGTFRIEATECVTCYCCHAEAPGLIAEVLSSIDADKTSGIVRQPVTNAEYEKILSAVSICVVDCIYYDGKDPCILSVYDRVKVGLHADEIWPKRVSNDHNKSSQGKCCLKKES